MSAALPLLRDETEPRLRRAALLLHGLAADDQAWLLQRLPGEQGTRVRALLDELRQLGIAPDPQAVESVLAEAAMAEASPPAPRVDLSAQAALAQASPAVLAELLRDEPASLIARLLQAGHWAWKAELLPLLPASTRQALRQFAGPLPAAPRLDAALIETLADQLPARPASSLMAAAAPVLVPPATPPQAGRLGRWARRLGSRLGTQLGTQLDSRPGPTALRGRQ